jgi:D-inositol-3-phosphate glycosyltransferase
MRVLLVTHYALPHQGGIEVLVDREAHLLASAGHEVVILASAVGAERPNNPHGIKIHRVAAWNWPERRLQVPWPIFSLSLLPTVWRDVQWCEVVHAHGLLYQSSVLALLAARILGRPSLVTEHIGLAWYPPGLRRIAQRVAMETVGRSSARLAGQCFGHHERVVALLRRLVGPRGNVTYLRNPLDQTLFRPSKIGEREAERNKLRWHTNRPKVLFIGRLIERKGIDLLLAAKDPAYDLVFCGPGDPGILTKHLGVQVEYMPPRSQRELISLYHAADVLAVPSRAEGGLPLVVQEALACGLPAVLGTDPGLAIYQQCKGLSFCALTPDAIRSALLEVLKQEQITGTQGDKIPLDNFLPEQTVWLDKLYRRATEQLINGSTLE